MCSVGDGVDKTECDNWSDGIAESVQNEPMTHRSWDKRWNNTIGDSHSIQNNLMDGSNTWNTNWRGNWRRDGLTSHSIKSVAQAV